MGILHGSKFLNNGVTRNIGDRKDILFWKDVWFHMSHLEQFTSDQDRATKTVDGYLLPIGWNIQKLQAALSLNLVNEISAIYVKKNNPKADSFY